MAIDHFDSFSTSDILRVRVVHIATRTILFCNNGQKKQEDVGTVSYADHCPAMPRFEKEIIESAECEGKGWRG